MENSLSILIIGAVASTLTAFVKRWLPNIDPKIIVAVMAIAGGVAWAFIKKALPESTVETILLAFSFSVAFHETLIKNLPPINGK